MSKTLNLVEHMLAMGRKYQELGLRLDALRVLGKLSGFRELPGAVAEEVQARLAEIQIKRRKYQRARRHLTAALRHRPNEARYHYLMGLACLAEGRGDLDRADEHLLADRWHWMRPRSSASWRRVCWLFAWAGPTRGWPGCARRRPRSDDAAIVAKLVKGLRQSGKGDEARRVLRAALFRNARVPRFRRLWREFQFQQLRQEQQRQRLDREGLADREDEPVLLPFARRPAGARRGARVGSPPGRPGHRTRGPSHLAGQGFPRHRGGSAACSMNWPRAGFAGWAARLAFAFTARHATKQLAYDRGPRQPAPRFSRTLAAPSCFAAPALPGPPTSSPSAGTLPKTCSASRSATRHRATTPSR